MEVSQSSSVVGFPNVCCLSSNSSTKHGGVYGFCTPPMLGVTTFFHQKVDWFHPAEGASFSAAPKRNCANLVGIFSAQKMEWIYHTTRFFECVKRKEFVLINGWIFPFFGGKVDMSPSKFANYSKKTPRFIGRKCIFSTSRRWRPYPWQGGKKWDENVYVVYVFFVAPLTKIIKSIQAESILDDVVSWPLSIISSRNHILQTFEFLKFHRTVKSHFSWRFAWCVFPSHRFR